MRKAIKEALAKWIDAENKLTAELRKLAEDKLIDECNCGAKDKGVVHLIHEGEYREIVPYCLECGGMIIEIR